MELKKLSELFGGKKKKEPEPPEPPRCNRCVNHCPLDAPRCKRTPTP